MRFFSLALAAAAASLLCALPAFAADQDTDGVQDGADRCPWVDDRIDLDANGIADCAETMLNEFGFQSELLMLSNYAPYVANEHLDFTPDDDFAGYWGSGAARVSGGPAWSDNLSVTECIPVDHWRNYVAMAQVGAKLTGGTIHELVIREYAGPNCSNQFRMLSSGYYISQYNQILDHITPATIVVTYDPPINVRSIRLVATTPNVTTASASGWYDNISIHPLPGSKGNPGQTTHQPPLPPKH